MSTSQNDTSPNDQIYLAESSLLPVACALGTAIVLIGFITLWPVSIIGAFVLLLAVGRWIKQTRAETGLAWFSLADRLSRRFA